MDVRDLVAAGDHPPVERGRDARGDCREIGAEVGQRRDLERGDLAVFRRADLDVGVMVAAVRGVQIVLGAILEELHRTAQLLRKPQHQRHVEVDEDFRAKPAADVRRDDPDLLLGNAEHERRDDQLMDVRRLRGRPEGVLLGARIVVADRAARLHRGRDQPLVEDALADPHLGVGQRAVDRLGIRAACPVHDDVVRRVLVELRRARLDRLPRVDDRRQLVEVDLDRLQGVIGLVDAFRDDDRDRIADLMHLAQREQPRRGDVVVDPGGLPGAGKRIHLGEILTGEHADDARHGLRAAGVDAADPGVGHRRAQHGRIGHAGQPDIVEEVPAAGHQFRVFAPPDRLCRRASSGSLDGCCHVSVPPETSCCLLPGELIAPILQILRGVLDDVLMLEIEVRARTRLDGATAPLLRRVLDRLDDVLVPGAAAEVAFQGVADLGFGRIRVAVEERVRGHDHAWGAVAALQTVHLPEAHLDRVVLAVLGNAFDGGQLGAVGLHRQAACSS